MEELNEKIKFQVGDTFKYEKVFTQDDFNQFAELSKDYNPIHVDPEFSSKTKFGKTVAHGMFLFSHLNKAFEEVFSNSGFILIEQSLKFSSPTYTDEHIQIILDLINIETSENIFTFETLIEKPNGSFGLEGITKIKSKYR